MSNFRVGQKVVCVDAAIRAGIGHGPALTKGGIYEIMAVAISPCCSMVVLDVGLSLLVPNNGLMNCPCGGSYPDNGRWWINSRRFRPLSELDLSEELARTEVQRQLSTEQEVVRITQPQRS